MSSSCNIVLWFLFLVNLGMTAPQAAGAIHSDFEKGFIRAETVRIVDRSWQVLSLSSTVTINIGKLVHLRSNAGELIL